MRFYTVLHSVAVTMGRIAHNWRDRRYPLSVAVANPGGDIRRIRLAAGMTQAEFATALEVSRCTISAVERGRTAPPKRLLDRATVLFMADGHQVPTNERPSPSGDLSTSRDGGPVSASGPAPDAQKRSRPEGDSELVSLRKAIEGLTQEVQLGLRNMEHMANRRPGGLRKAIAAAAIAYGTLGAFVLTGILARHGLQPVLALMGDLAADSARWLLDIVPFV